MPYGIDRRDVECQVEGHEMGRHDTRMIDDANVIAAVDIGHLQAM